MGIPSSLAGVVINEIMYNPSTKVSDEEFLELYNSGQETVDLSGWAFDSGIDFVIPEGTLLPADGYLVICRNEFRLRQKYALAAAVLSCGNYAPSNLSNSGEQIRLIDREGNRVNQVSYTDSFPWPIEADGDGSSLELVHPGVDTNNPIYWRGSYQPTPGKKNSRAVVSVPPRIQAVQRSPQSPGSQDAVTITAIFAPGDALKTVTLFYQVNGGNPLSLPMAGQGPVYTATIPAQAQHALVSYQVQAVNAENYSVSYPVAGAQNALLYRVQNQPVPAGQVVINEVMYNPVDVEEEENEWIELYNLSSAVVDLSYWIIKDDEDSHLFRLPNGTQIPAQGYLLIATERASGWPGTILAGLNFSLNNAGDAVRLFDPNEVLIAEMTYDDNGEWPYGMGMEGCSLELLQPERPNGEANNWAPSPRGGTPGQPNHNRIVDLSYHDYDVIISELHYHPEDEEEDGNIGLEFIELYNRGAQAVDLSGWSFSRGVEFEFPAGSAIPGRGFLLVCKEESRYVNIPNRVGNYVGSLANGGEAVALSNEAGVVIDFVEYDDTPPWLVLPDGEGPSLELVSPVADNKEAQYWRNGTPMSPGAANSEWLDNAPPRITRVSHAPRVPKATIVGQEVELLDYVKVRDSWKYFKGTSEPPENWAALDFDDSSWLSGRSGFGFGDNDDTTVLSDMQNRYLSVYIRTTFTVDNPASLHELVLNVDYDDGFVAYLNGTEIARALINGTPPRYNTVASGNREAGEAELFILDNFRDLLKDGTNVLAVQGHNVSLSSSDMSLIPSLSGTRVIQEGDKESDAIVITARVRDEDGVDSATLHYQRLTSSFGYGLQLEEWRQMPMVDDGTQGDAVAGDGYYTATLTEVETIYPNELWRYKVSAVDAQGQEALLPLAEELTPNYALYVVDGKNPDPFPTIRLFMEQSVWTWLNNNVSSDEEQPCLVVIDGEVYDLYQTGGVRFRGHTLRNKPKKSFKIQFAKGNRWDGKRTINLNANYQTSPLVRGEAGFMEHLAYEVFRQAGCITPETRAVELYLNSDYYGLFIETEQYNEDFLDDHNLSDEMVIFKAGVKATPSYMTPESSLFAYQDKYENMIGKSKDIQILIDFIEGLDAARDVQAFFEANMNIDAYLNYLVCIALVSHVDSTEKNYFPTRDGDGLWRVLPWDISHSFGEIHTRDQFPFITNYSLLDGAAGGVFGTNRMRQKFLSVPLFKTMYYQRLREFSDHLFTRQHLDPLFDSYWIYMKDAIYRNMDRWNSPGQIDQMVEEMKKYVTGRREFILKDANVRPANLAETPQNLTPADGALVSSRTPVLAVKTPSSGNPLETEWEIQADNTDFFQPYWRSKGEAVLNLTLPAGLLASNQVYSWRMRWKFSADQAWSDWSVATAFTTGDRLLPPNVNNIVVTEMDQSVRMEWDLPTAPDLARVDIYLDGELIESTPIDDNRVRIQDLTNGRMYTFTLYTVGKDRSQSTGITVNAMPKAQPTPSETVAYFRFEGNLEDTEGNFAPGLLFGQAALLAEGAQNPVPLTSEANQGSLALTGKAGDGFQFGGSESILDIAHAMTVECYARVALGANRPMILLDRYLDADAEDDGIWRFGLNLSQPGSLDFFFNDLDSNDGYAGRLHIASLLDVVPQDGSFHHFAAVVNLNNAQLVDKVQLFVDAQPVQTWIVYEDSQSYYESMRTNSGLPVVIGAKRTANGTGDVLEGAIDEVRISAVSLVPEEFLHLPGTAVLDWSLY
ncbi:MAG: lamin tail domain-containing protein [bacterium]|nr:lamin tail domain-containing protein [bacterium]